MQKVMTKGQCIPLFCCAFIIKLGVALSVTLAHLAFDMSFPILLFHVSPSTLWYEVLNLSKASG